MRVFGYYITHTIINAIKKLFKTWIAFILIIMLGGGLLGGVIGLVASSLSKDVVEEVSQNEEVQAVVEDSVDSLNEVLSIEVNQMIELVVSGLFLFLFFLGMFSAKGMSDIFQPADVNILFSAPMKPQSVMMFRLLTTLGMQIIFSFFMLFQIPNMVVNLHIPVTSAIMIFSAWILVNLLITLGQLLLYIISSYSEVIKKASKIIVGALLAVFVVLFGYNFVNNGNDVLRAAVSTLTGGNTFWIPFWGWTRGMCMNAIYGNNALAYMFLGLNIVGIIALIVIIWNLKVDFYEDALISAEKRAAIAEKSKDLKTSVVRTKDRSDKIKRDGFNKGSGANVFFFKTMYNRKRLSYFGFLTKTMILYICAVGLAVFLSIKADFPNELGFLIIGLFFTLVAFCRSMSNPLNEDLSRDFFAMIPCSARSKLLYSILGGITNTALDIIVPYAFAAVWFKAGVGDAIVWFLFLLAVDIYGTVVGAFVMMSVSITLPETVQKFVQIIFIYFGIMPAIIFLVLGIVLKNMVLFMPFGIVLNLMLSFVFFMIIPVFMQNGRK